MEFPQQETRDVICKTRLMVVCPQEMLEIFDKYAEVAGFITESNGKPNRSAWVLHVLKQEMKRIDAANGLPETANQNGSAGGSQAPDNKGINGPARTRRSNPPRRKMVRK